MAGIVGLARGVLRQSVHPPPLGDVAAGLVRMPRGSIKPDGRYGSLCQPKMGNTEWLDDLC